MSKDDTLEEVEFVGPGAMLKAAREKQGLSLDDVADKLHLRVSIISGLEDEQYSTEISATFTKGYLKLYSKLLGLDDALVLDAYKKLGKSEKEPAKLQSFSKKVARQASDQRLMMVTYLVLVIVIALVVAWWLQQDEAPFESMISSASDAIKEEVTSEPKPTVTEIVPVQSSQTANVAQTTTKDESAAEEATGGDVTAENNELTSDANVGTQEVEQALDSTVEPVVSTINESTESLQSDVEGAITEVEEQISGPEIVQATAQETSANLSNSDATEAETTSDDVVSINPVETQLSDKTVNQALGLPVDLVFQFAGDCWMKLTDATGEDVAYGIKKSGRVMPVSGIPPFEVVLGAPEVVQISYNGEPIDMNQFRAGYTARFTLPLTE